MSWKKDGGSAYASVSDEDKKILQSRTYSSDNDGWVQWKATLTAPSDADSFNFEIRTNKQDSPGGVRRDPLRSAIIRPDLGNLDRLGK